jgi:hypothetical protein
MRAAAHLSGACRRDRENGEPGIVQATFADPLKIKNEPDCHSNFQVLRPLVAGYPNSRR